MQSATIHRTRFTNVCCAKRGVMSNVVHHYAQVEDCVQAPVPQYCYPRRRECKPIRHDQITQKVITITIQLKTEFNNALMNHCYNLLNGGE